MFETLIVSEPERAGARSRRNYFLVSTIAVGTIVLTGVVASMFAEDITLGTDNFEFSVLVMPVDPPAAPPERPRPQPQRSKPAPSSSQSQVATRTELIAPIERPDRVPTTTSVTPNKVPAMPRYDPVQLGNTNTDPVTRVGRVIDNSAPAGGGLTAETGTVAATKPEDEPPPRKPDPPRVPPVVTRGVVNGQATYLPKPAYPTTALAVRAEGKVNVQVLIDERGRVVSATAVSGNGLLRSAAESAARSARFTPTKLSDVPVKVTGVIVYNFNLG